jgi:ankyrin repeat protein
VFCVVSRNVLPPHRAQLYIAADQGHAACCESLLSLGGANVDAACESGWTALITACDEGHADVVKCLLRHGANQSTALADGRTARSVAVEDDVLQLLSG